MAETRLDTLRVEASLDASGFERGAQAIAQGSREIEASVTAASGAVASSESRIVQSATAFERLRNQLDPSAKSAADFERAQRTLDRALEAGQVNLQQHGQYLQQLQAKYQAAGQTAVAFGTTATTSGSALGRVGQVAGQAGFQMQDFAGQVAAGTSALTAMGQQLPQFLGIFGTGGAVAGAAVAVGVLAYKLLETEDASKALAKSADANEKAFGAAAAAAKAYADGIDSHNAKLMQMAAYYQSVTKEVRALAAAQIAQQRTETQRAAARRMGEISGNEISAPLNETIRSSGTDILGSVTGYLETEVSVPDPNRDRLNDAVRAFRNYRGDDPVQALAEFRQRAEEIGRSNSAAGKAAQEAAKRAVEAFPEMQKLAESLKQFGEHEQAIFNQVLPLPPEAAPNAPEAKGAAAAARKALREREAELKRIQRDAEALQNSFENFWDQAEGRAETRATSEANKAYEKTQKDMTKLARDEEKERAQLAKEATDNVVRYGADAFADLFDGNTKGWKGMLDGFLNLTKQIMARIMAEMVLRPLIEPIMGSIMGGLTGGAGMGGIGQSIAGYMNAPLLNGVSGGSMLGAGVMGFGVGMMANSLAGGNRTGGSIGSGIGAAGGAVVGSFFGPVGTMAGSVIGGALGGVVGGLFGGGKPKPMRGDVTVGIDAAGLAVATGASGRGKGWDSERALDAAQQQIDQLNAQLSQRGLSFRGAEDLGKIGSGASKNSADLLDSVAGALDRLSHSSASVQTAIDNTVAAGGNLARVLENIDWVQQVYEPMMQSVQGNSEFERSLNQVRAQFQPVIDKAGQLGLATGDLAAAMQRAIDDITNQRNFEYASHGWNMELRAVSASSSAGSNSWDARMRAYNIQAETEKFNLEGLIRQWGLTAEQAQEKRIQLERVHNDERERMYIDQAERDAQIRQQQADEAARIAQAAADEQNRIWQQQAYDAQRAAENQAREVQRIQEAAYREQLRQQEEHQRNVERQREADERAAAEREARWQAGAGSAANFAGSLAAWVRGKSTSDESPMSLQERYSAQAINFNNMVNRAGGGDVRAMAQVQAEADAFLDLARQIGGSGEGYANDFRNVMLRMGELSRISEDNLTNSFFAAELRGQTVALSDELQHLRAAVNKIVIELAQGNAMPARAA